MSKSTVHLINIKKFLQNLYTWIWIQQLKLMRFHADPDPYPKPLCNEQERREYQLAVPYYRMSQLAPLAVLERLELSAPPLNPGSGPCYKTF
jgi:hypothetical protein